jgi:hypothetical protein
MARLARPATAGIPHYDARPGRPLGSPDALTGVHARFVRF